MKKIIEFFKEKGFAILLLSVIFTSSSLFWTSDIVYNQRDLSSIDLGWPIHFITRDMSQLEPPAWWFPHRYGLGTAAQANSTSLNFFSVDVVLNFLIIFSIIFVVLKLNPKLLFLRKIISVKFIVAVLGVFLLVLISLFIFSYITQPKINIGTQPPHLLLPQPIINGDNIIVKEKITAPLNGVIK